MRTRHVENVRHESGNMKFSPNMFRFETAGESHGECLVATLTGLPAGIPISLDAVNHELWRRQQGYGRGGRMKIESDQVEFLAGLRGSVTLGSPLAVMVRNRDYENNRALMDPLTGGGKPLTNLFLSLAQVLGVNKLERFGDSTGLLQNL